MRLRTLLLPALTLLPALAHAQSLASDTEAAAKPLGDTIRGSRADNKPAALPEDPQAADDASSIGAGKTPVLYCVPSAKAICCKPGTPNCDPWGWLYSPELCDEASDCECAGLGVARCGVCPDDKGSDFIQKKVCYCQGLPKSDSGSPYECHPGKPNGPKRVLNNVVPSSEPTEEPRKKRSASKNSETSGSNSRAAAIGAIAAGVAVLALLGCCMYCCLFGMFKKRKDDEESENTNDRSKGDIDSKSLHGSKLSAAAVTSTQVSGVNQDADVENGLEKVFSGFVGGAKGSYSNSPLGDGDVEVVGAAPPLPEGPPPADWKSGNGNQWEGYFDEATEDDSHITLPPTYESSGYDLPLPPGLPPPAGCAECKYTSWAVRNSGYGAFEDEL